MKTGNKSQFSTKFGSVLTKFKDNSTVQVGHEQVKNIFGEFPMKDIFIAFISKMDTIEQMNEREKKEISKIYITFIEVYKTQLLYDQYYEKFLESLNKKAVGVSQAIGHICKTLLSRIQDQEQLYPFVSIIINIFHNNTEVSKILKQVTETISPIIIASLQLEIISILQQKMGSAKNKSDYLDAILSLVLNLEEKLEVESNVVSCLLKYLRHEDWSCRKNCIDIAYALLVINQSINDSIHNIVKELKYDKIKHVRDSVNNYEKLHEQIFGKEVVQKAPPPPSIRQTKIKSQISNKKICKSPIPTPTKQVEQEQQKSNSLDKSMKLKQKNENFFKNAKNSDVIKINEGNTSIIDIKKSTSDEVELHHSQSVIIPAPLKEQEPIRYSQGKNFEAYLQNRVSPKQKQRLTPFEKPAIAKESQVKKALSKFESMKSSEGKGGKFNYQNEFQHFKKKSRVEAQTIKSEESKENISFGDVELLQRNQPQFSLSYISNKNQINHFQEFKALLFAFQKRINERLDKMDSRIDKLQRQRIIQAPSPTCSKESKSFQVLAISQLQESPRSTLLNETPNNESKYSYTDREGIQSNLQQKIRASIANQNWDEAYTIALTNNKKNILLNLLERCVFPKDKTVEECILLEARKLLGYMSTLKWLKYYLMEKSMSYQRMQKLKEDLEKRAITDNRNYEMMRQILLNEIEQKLTA